MERLVALAKEGDAQAQNALYRRYKNRPLAVCRRITHDNELSEELANDAFLIAFDKLGCLNDPEKFGPWLAAIAARLALRQLKRKGGKAIPLSSLEGFDVAFAESGAPFTEEELQRAIDMLPPGYRQVFTMSVIEGRQHKEIASLLNIEPHSSSSQLYHARAMLRQILGPLLGVVLLLLAVPVLLVGDRRSVPPASAALRRDAGVEMVEREECVSGGLPVGGSRLARLQEDAASLCLDSVAATDEDGVFFEGRAIEEPEGWKQPTAAEVGTDVPVVMQQPRGYRDDAGRWSVKVSMAAPLSGQATAQRQHALLLPSVSCTDAHGGYGYVSIDNWRDCRRYVIDNMDLFSSEVAEALIRIAQNNGVANDEGRIMREERHEQPVRFCVEADRSLRSWTRIHCGLGCGMYRSWFRMGLGKDRIDEYQRVVCLDLPAGVSFRLFDSPRVVGYCDVELALQIPVSVRYKTQFVVEGQTNSPGDGDGITLVDRSSFGGHPSMEARMKIGVSYNITKRCGLFSECGIGCNLFYDEKIATYATVRPVVFSMQSGLQFNF